MKNANVEAGGPAQSAIANRKSEMGYEGRAREMDARAMNERLSNDALRFREFRQECKAVEKFSVRAGNIGRELGESFAEYFLPPDRAAAENYFNANYRQKLRMSFETFHWLQAVARKLPERVESMEDLFPAIQTMLFAGELLEPAERDGPQEAHESTPYTLFFERLSKTRVELDKAFARAGEWDEATRSSVREQVEKFEAWLIGVKGKLN